MESIKEVWEGVERYLRTVDGMPQVVFDVWIAGIEPYAIKDGEMVVYVNTNYQRRIILENYAERIMNAFQHVLGIPLGLKIIAREVPAVETKQETPAAPETAVSFEANFTFDNFIVGSSNKFAYAASQAVATKPAVQYNPLFIYGGSGLGKTHLLYAICNEIRKNMPAAKIFYTKAETMTNEIIEAIQKHTTADLRAKYRQVDVLLVDDIQFLAGKESTQEEFFHTFNHLHTSGKQIIISSDKPPKDIETLEARLRTRFEWGLIADISSPNYETRMAILQKKIELDHLEKYNIPNDVLEYIATNVKTNIRELEGSLNKLIALYKLNNNESIDIALAAEALKDIISSDNKREVTPELILDIVSDHFGVSIADLKGGKRNAEIVFPRQIAMYLIRNMTETSLKAVGVILGGKDHSTIKHGIEKIENELQADETLSNTINIIKKKINPA